MPVRCHLPDDRVPSPSAVSAAATRKGNFMKKLLVILILAAIGIAVVKKVREA